MAPDEAVRGAQSRWRTAPAGLRTTRRVMSRSRLGVGLGFEGMVALGFECMVALCFGGMVSVLVVLGAVVQGGVVLDSGWLVVEGESGRGRRKSRQVTLTGSTL